MMNPILLKYIRNCLFLAISSAGLLHVPILGALWGLLTLMPLTHFFPELGRTGVHVEYGFMWLIIKSPFAWITITLYYLIFSALLLAIPILLKLKNRD